MNSIVYDFVKYAQDDLEGSLDAFQKKRFPQAVSLLQQANEKLAKAILIESGTCSVNEFKDKFSHDVIKPVVYSIKETIKGGKEGIERLKNRFSVEEDALFSSDAIAKIKKLESNTNELEHYKTLKDWLRINEEEIIELLNELKGLMVEDVTFELTEEMLIDFPDKLFQQVPFLKLIPNEVEKLEQFFSSKELRIELATFINKFIIKVVLISKAYIITNCLSMILCPHQNRSRFPDIEKEDYNTYDKDHPIIKCYFIFHELTEFALNKMKEYLRSPPF